MKRYISILIITLVSSIAVYAQETNSKPQYWTSSVQTQLGFSQVSLTNWAAGGYGSIALNSYINAKADYAKEKMIWNNQLQLGYGFIHTFGEGYKKSDDRIVLDSKFGYRAVEKLYFSAVYNFTTQFTIGYKTTKGTEVVSNFMAPAYTSLGLGIDYTPTSNLSMNIAPLTGKVVMVKDPMLRTKYGNMEDQFAKWELGAQLKINAKVAVQDFTAETVLTLFSNYLDKPQNIKVNWDVAVAAKLTKYLSATFRTYLIYDDNIKFLEKKDKTGSTIVGPDGKPVLYPGVQFKELFSMNFTYTIKNR